MSLLFTYSFFTVQSAALGDEILAANTILLQLWHLMAYGVDGFAYAAESITGRYMGARQGKRLRRAVGLLIAWGMGLGAVFSLLYGLFDVQLLRIFTDNDALIALALSFMAWTIAAPLVNSFCFMLDGVFIGATVTAPMRNSHADINISGICAGILPDRSLAGKSCPLAGHGSLYAGPGKHSAVLFATENFEPGLNYSIRMRFLQ